MGVMTEYLSTTDIAAMLGVERNTVSVWIKRHPDFPSPDAHIGDVAGWLPYREQEIRDWHKARTPKTPTGLDKNLAEATENFKRMRNGPT